MFQWLLISLCRTRIWTQFWWLMTDPLLNCSPSLQIITIWLKMFLRYYLSTSTVLKMPFLIEGVGVQKDSDGWLTSSFRTGVSTWHMVPIMDLGWCVSINLDGWVDVGWVDVGWVDGHQEPHFLPLLQVNNFVVFKSFFLNRSGNIFALFIWVFIVFEYPVGVHRGRFLRFCCYSVLNKSVSDVASELGARTSWSEGSLWQIQKHNFRCCHFLCSHGENWTVTRTDSIRRTQR